MMVFMLSIVACPWPCKADVLEILISAIVGGIVGYFLGQRARETH
jgi:hypothetical protein